MSLAFQILGPYDPETSKKTVVCKKKIRSFLEIRQIQLFKNKKNIYILQSFKGKSMHADPEGPSTIFLCIPSIFC